MPMVPAFCNTCGTVFNSGMFFENSRHITMTGCTTGPCPKGAVGSGFEGLKTRIMIFNLQSLTPESHHDLVASLTDLIFTPSSTKNLKDLNFLVTV